MKQLPVFTQWIESHFPNAEACTEMGGELIYFNTPDEDAIISAAAYHTPEDEENVNWEHPTESSYKIVIVAHDARDGNNDVFVVTTADKTSEQVKAEFISAMSNAIASMQ